MLNGITELLNEVIADPERIQTPKSDHEESQEIKRLNAEISKALNTVSFDKEAIKQKYLADAPAAFDEVEADPNMEKLWRAYQKKFSYAADLSWHTVMESIRSLYELVWE